MLTETEFMDLVRDIARLNGLSEAVAADLMATIGDTPITDEEGYVVATASEEQGGKAYRLIWPEEEG